MDFGQILRNISWRPGIGDATVAGWITVFVYFAVGVLALVYANRQRQAKEGQTAVWFFLAFLLFFLGFNKQLDLQTLLTQIGREISKTQGWYAERRGVQLAFLTGLAGFGLAGLLALGWLWRRTIRRHALIFGGLALLLGFVLVRAVSFHAIDAVIQQRILGVRFNTILELGSLFFIGLGFWGAYRTAAGGAVPATPTRSRPWLALSAAGLIGLAALVAIFQLLSSDTFDWASDFEQTVPPYQHPSQIVQQAAAQPFLETFDGAPAAPQPWRPLQEWDVTTFHRDWTSWERIDPLAAAFGPACEPPPATHDITTFDEAVFQCDNQLVTAINGQSYAAVYLTPAHLLDFSEGEATLRFDLSTGRTSGREWVEIWLTPFEEQIQLPGIDWMPALNGHPTNALHLYMPIDGWRIEGELIQNGQVTALAGEWFELDDSKPATVTMELRLSQGHVWMGLAGQETAWVDAPFNTPLNWQTAVVQLSHHSFEPTKDCGTADCAPNSWQWDNITLNPAVPFTILGNSQRYINRGSGPELRFAAASPAQAYLRFIAFGEDVQVSFDSGTSWQPAQRQAYAKEEIGYQSYWTPMPPGIDTVHLRARDWEGQDWQIRDISIWSLAAP